ncbi:Dabb family protein [Parachryseolinea silvisoli]|nr:Dabb family protein [Parachryseolinea silvisoli]
MSNKNNYDYGLSMEFDSARAYEAYQKDPLHEAFVQNYWVQCQRVSGD